MNGSALLGLGKNLLIMIKTKIVEKDKEYFIYYNQDLNLISFSHNFANDFSTNLDLVSKCNINILNIFNINQDILKKKLEKIKRDINNYKPF